MKKKKKKRLKGLEIIKTQEKCTTGPTATTAQSSKQLTVKLYAKNQKIPKWGSEYNFEKARFEPKFDLLTPHQAWGRVFLKATDT